MSKRKPVRRLTGGLLGSRSEGYPGIDEGVKDLVLDLNSRGYRTSYSCEGDTFLTAEVWMKLLAPVTEEELEDVRDIIRQHTSIPFILNKSRWGKRYISVGIIFREPLGGQSIDLEDVRYDSSLWDLACQEGAETIEEEDEWMRKKLQDKYFWSGQIVEEEE